MNKLRIVVICTPDKSDLFFANQLAKRLNVVGIMVENNRRERDNTPIVNKTLKLVHKPSVLIRKVYEKFTEILRNKIADYNKPENAVDFGEEGRKLLTSDDVAVIYTTGFNNINAPEYIDWLAKIRPDVVAVCGASILGENIISIPKFGVLNLHGGLAQKYRGLFTTEWAIHNGQPEYVGATVHYVSTGIDDGDIVYQGRPRIELNDNPHSLYVKVVKMGVDMMTQAILDLQQGKGESFPLQEKGDLYLERMFTDKIRMATWKMIRKGVIEEYLANKASRDSEVRAMMTSTFREFC